MRIYEFAQQKNISSKDVIEKLQHNGFDVKSHMSVLDDNALAFLEKDMSKIATPQPVSPIEKTVSEQQLSKNKPTSPKKIVERQIASVKEQDSTQFSQTQPLVLNQMSVSEFAEKIKKPITEVIVTLLKWGIIATRNQIIADSLIKRLAEHYEIPIAKSTEKKDVAIEKEKKIKTTGDFKKRPPVVVVVGHVDHGKTTLLDYIRKTRVALKEKGGITQHLGAYEAVTAHGNIVFLDTPGHEAFGKIRQRGIKVADLVVLVVAADDGVMPQTIEALKHAQAMEVPIIVALNKVDRVDSARLEVVKRQLSQYNIIVEDWGGDVICVAISAKFGTGIDQLLEMLSLQAEIMELRAEINVPANGYILESSIEKGRGPVATVITQNGVLKVGDYFSCGKTTGHISSLVDSSGQRIKEASPSIPVQVAGFDERPEAGDFFEVISKDDYLKIKSSGGEKQTLHGKRFMYENGINIVVKADNHSSLEAIVEGIDRLSKKLKRGFNIVRHLIGDVSESDIEFAYNTGSRIVCFNVKTESNAYDLADRKKISILHYGIIYTLLDDLSALSSQLTEVELVRTKIGEATVLKVFDIKKIGIIAGSIIKDGRFVRDGFAVIWRGRSKIGEGKISSLQRDKKTVKEIATGFECAFMVNGFNDWMVDDRVECFIDIPKK
jgi:translation initiation factor IF-2